MGHALLFDTWECIFEKKSIRYVCLGLELGNMGRLVIESTCPLSPVSEITEEVSKVAEQKC